MKRKFTVPAGGAYGTAILQLTLVTTVNKALLKLIIISNLLKLLSARMHTVHTEHSTQALNVVMFNVLLEFFKIALNF